nr:MAG TPA: hypothetical protein [Caudoviricetes sp.]
MNLLHSLNKNNNKLFAFLSLLLTNTPFWCII